MSRKIELIAPAGNLEKLIFAFKYGADAVYLGGKIFNLRAKTNNFSYEELERAVALSKKFNRNIYFTLNIYFFNNDFKILKDYLGKIYDIGIRNLIISDIGALYFINKNFKNMFNIAVSTQANITNTYTVEFLKSQGVKKVILARELNLKQIKEISDNVDIDIETFIHGAMCVAYSGRCLLSEYFNNRSANRGLCSQPCRWEYSIAEPTRKDEFLPVEENQYGTYILSSKDLCTVEFIDKLIEAGINSFKIEGRMKSIYYVANTTRVYRYAIDSYFNKQKVDIDFLLEELNSVSHRPYFPGFFFGYFRKNSINYSDSYVRNYKFIGYIGRKVKKNIYELILKDKLESDYKIEIIFPDMKNEKDISFKILDSEFKVTDRGIINRKFYIQTESELEEYTIIRKKI